MGNFFFKNFYMTQPSINAEITFVICLESFFLETFFLPIFFVLGSHEPIIEYLLQLSVLLFMHSVHEHD